LVAGLACGAITPDAEAKLFNEPAISKAAISKAAIGKAKHNREIVKENA
jgi:hypothetical protein